MGIFDLTGRPFLLLYAALFVGALIASILIPRWLRAEGRAPAGLDVEGLAYLAGGAGRYVDAVMARLLAARDVAMEAGGKVRVLAPAAGRGAPDRAVLLLDTPAPWHKVSATLARQAARVEARLVEAGLLIHRAGALQLRFWAIAPWLALLAIGATKWEIGRLRDKPVGILTFFLIVTVFALVVRFASVDRRTRAALDLLRRERDGRERLRRAPRAEEMPLAVALYGTGVLAASEFGAYHALRAQGGGDAGVSADSGSGGSGCGGGGCGGCGS
ncbi:MAG: TIGR04222 domain-containing membrane protein [Sphingomonas sp.]|uniref:TIGR04222 domain-containing membrane protein n=1 Tax=Sphingomonas sp. TaxID=28214 RepID=UPI0025EF0EB7|nr:TIGR04222 domain-containing membrane protein [Sphingomonas sp.]MBX9882080.1 TIGR04222 domain-containing membrane protein [Sphingomonas sp.]